MIWIVIDSSFWLEATSNMNLVPSHYQGPFYVKQLVDTSLVGTLYSSTATAIMYCTMIDYKYLLYIVESTLKYNYSYAVTHLLSKEVWMRNFRVTNF